MPSEREDEVPAVWASARATAWFLNVETGAALILGLLLALATLLSIGTAAAALWGAVLRFGAGISMVETIDRLLVVFMLVEILHTVRVSFRAGTLVCEPFLIVGLIASIRRVLVITLESSEANHGASMTVASAEFFRSTMIELGVLAGLILVMVVSIWILRRSEAGGRVAS